MILRLNSLAKIFIGSQWCVQFWKCYASSGCSFWIEILTDGEPFTAATMRVVCYSVGYLRSGRSVTHIAEDLHGYCCSMKLESVVF